MNVKDCPLCHARAEFFFSDPKDRAAYYHCRRCGLRFLDPANHLLPEEELERYKLHRNDVESPAYQEFVRPLVDALASRCPSGSAGLDFGSGADAIMAHQLTRAGMAMEVYDPLFSSNRSALGKRYDLIAASEVAEHFYRPAEEFSRLRKLLKPGGLLGLMTLLVDEKTDFLTWHYRRDPTHVVFYAAQTFEWIRDTHGFNSCTVIHPRTVLLHG